MLFHSLLIMTFAYLVKITKPGKQHMHMFMQAITKRLHEVMHDKPVDHSHVSYGNITVWYCTISDMVISLCDITISSKWEFLGEVWMNEPHTHFQPYAILIVLMHDAWWMHGSVNWQSLDQSNGVDEESVRGAVPSEMRSHMILT